MCIGASFWCEEGSPGLEMNGPGLASFALRDFGHWLRFEVTLDGPQAFARLLITLALKE